MSGRVIFHIDVNSAFLSWEASCRIRHLGGKLDLRRIPSAVGGDRSKRHGIILAKSIPAGKYNIHMGETVVAAVGIRFYDLSYAPHQRVLESPTNLTGES